MTQSHANARSNPMTDHRDEHEAYAITPLPAGISNDEYIRRLRRQCDMEAAHIAELKAQIKTLRDERDEARREVCVIIAQHSNDPIPDEEYFVCATRGWDCFKEEAK